MKQTAWLLATALAAVAATGCGSKNQPARVAAEQLQKSFQKADASITEEVVQASNALQASNYTQAVIIMDRVVQAQPIDAAQKNAVDALLIQTRKAIEQDPKLNTPQLYQAMSDLLTRVHGEN